MILLVQAEKYFRLLCCFDAMIEYLSKLFPKKPIKI